MRTLNELLLTTPNDIDNFIQDILINPKNEAIFWDKLNKKQFSKVQEQQMLNCLEKSLLTEPNHAQALSFAGAIYGWSQHEHRNNTKGFDYIKRAASLNNVNATINLAHHYNDGMGIPKNPAEAMKLFKKLAEQDNPLALICLGDMHEKGAGIPKNSVEAAYCYRRALMLSHEDAKSRLSGLKNLYKSNSKLQYHCMMALDPKNVTTFHKQFPKCLANYILDDNLLIDKVKYELFFKLANGSLQKDESLHKVLTKNGIKVNTQSNGITTLAKPQLKPTTVATSTVLNVKEVFQTIFVNPKVEQSFWNKLHNNEFTLNEEESLLNYFEELQSMEGHLGIERLPTFIGGLYTFTKHPYKNIQTGLMLMGKATLLKDANTLYQLGVVYQNGAVLENNLVEAAIFFRRSYALSNKAALDNLISIRDKNPTTILIQYHCNRAISPERINHVFAEQVLDDQFATDKEKYNFFTRYQHQKESNTSCEVYAKIQEFMTGYEKEQINEHYDVEIKDQKQPNKNFHQFFSCRDKQIDKSEKIQSRLTGKFERHS